MKCDTPGPLHLLLVFTIAAVCVKHVSATFNFEELFRRDPMQCSDAAYPPPASTIVPKFVINLDLPLEERWKEVISAKFNEILELRRALARLLDSVSGGLLMSLIDDYGPKLLATLPSPYKEELTEIAKLSKMPLGEVVLYNVFYEFFTVCTSIVAENEKGQILHARNMDFGLFLGWNKTASTWSMTQVLRKSVVELEWRRGNKTVFHSVNFAGYIGVLTGYHPGLMSFTINERFNINGGFIGLFEWIVRGNRELQWVGFLARDVFERELSYDQATQTLATAKLLAPVYFIVGGNKAGEGVVITKDRGTTDANVSTMRNNPHANWYVLQTNYDNWTEPPFFDDRRTPAHHCMQQVGQKNISFEKLFQVLSTQPVLNKLTAYTTLMNVNEGRMETYLQKCGGNCAPW